MGTITREPVVQRRGRGSHRTKGRQGSQQTSPGGDIRYITGRLSSYYFTRPHGSPASNKVDLGRTGGECQRAQRPRPRTRGRVLRRPLSGDVPLSPHPSSVIIIMSPLVRATRVSNANVATVPVEDPLPHLPHFSPPGQSKMPPSGRGHGPAVSSAKRTWQPTNNKIVLNGARSRPRPRWIASAPWGGENPCAE